MEEIKVEALDLIINCVLKSIYQTGYSDEECEMLIENAFEQLSEMLDEEYKDKFFERMHQAYEDLQQGVQHITVMESIMEDLGWPSEN